MDDDIPMSLAERLKIKASAAGTTASTAGSMGRLMNASAGMILLSCYAEAGVHELIVCSPNCGDLVGVVLMTYMFVVWN